MAITNYRRLDGESDDELIFRVCKDKEQIGTWNDVKDILNELLGTDFGESTFRKKFQSFNKMFEANQKQFVDDEQILEDIKEQKRELEQAKIQFRDERNAWQNQNRVMARTDQKLDYLSELIESQGIKTFMNHNIPIIQDDNNDLAIMLSDLHIGSEFDSVYGQYNSDIAKDKLQEYFEKILKIQERHKSKNAYVLLCGDMISGSIHKSIQVTNRENVIEQIKIASDLISDFCYSLSEYFESVSISSVNGNHSRIEKKEDALKDERLDDLIFFIVEKSLGHIQNINFNHDRLDSTITDVEIRGNTYFICHGDYDRISESGIMRLCSMVGTFPTGIFVGHRHTPAYSEMNGVKIIQSGSLCGSGDDYTIEKRLYGKSNQTLCVCDCNGINCIYNVEL